MMRQFLIPLGCFVLAGFIAVASNPASGQSASETLIPESLARRAGLTRAWVCQLPVDRALNKVKHVDLQADLLLVVTSDGMLHVVDAETGALSWSMQAGNPKFVTLPAAASPTHIALINDTKLQVIDRGTRNVVFERDLMGPPASPPALFANLVVIPLVKGPLEFYALEEVAGEFVPPKYFASTAEVVGPPTGTSEMVVWTDRQRIHGRPLGVVPPPYDEPVIGEITTGLSTFAPHVYLGTEAGWLIACDEGNGQSMWSFAAGSPIYHPPIANGLAVYVLPEDGGMFAVRPESGEELWFAPDPRKFISASPDAIYTLDRFHRLTVLDAKSGGRIQALALPQRVQRVVNQATDRLYLFTDSGMIQCLREMKRTQPHRFAPSEAEPEVQPAAAPAPIAAPTEGDAGG